MVLKLRILDFLSHISTIFLGFPLVLYYRPVLECFLRAIFLLGTLSFPSVSTPPKTLSKSIERAIAPLVEESWDLTGVMVSPVASSSSSGTNSPLIRELVELSNAPFEDSPSNNFRLGSQSERGPKVLYVGFCIARFPLFVLFALIP